MSQSAPNLEYIKPPLSAQLTHFPGSDQAVSDSLKIPVTTSQEACKWQQSLHAPPPIPSDSLTAHPKGTPVKLNPKGEWCQAKII